MDNVELVPNTIQSMIMSSTYYANYLGFKSDTSKAKPHI